MWHGSDLTATSHATYGTQSKECTSLDGTVKKRMPMWAVFP